MATTINFRNPPTGRGTGIVDTGEVNKKDTTTTWTDDMTTKGTERDCTLENRRWNEQVQD